MVRSLRSTPITRASPLLRTGPPARLATVLNASQFLLLDALPLTATTPTAVSRHAFSRSIREQRIRLTSPPCRTPPGQEIGHPPDSSRVQKEAPFRCHLNSITTRHQRFTLVRLPDPHLTPPTTPFPPRSPRQSSANAARGGLKPLPEERLRRATILHLPHSTTSDDEPNLPPPSVFVTHPFPGLHNAGCSRGGASAILWAWSTCPGCRDRRWTG
jgi:hypothetical protein